MIEVRYDCIDPLIEKEIQYYVDLVGEAFRDGEIYLYVKEKFGKIRIQLATIMDDKNLADFYHDYFSAVERLINKKEFINEDSI